jgi:hypothetical protein
MQRDNLEYGIESNEKGREISWLFVINQLGSREMK